MQQLFTHAGRWLLALLALSWPSAAALAQNLSWQAALPCPRGASIVQALAADADGSIYVTGTFGRVGVFGATTLVATTTSDLFVAKWSPLTRDFVWAVKAGASSGATGYALAVGGGLVYVGGSLTGTADFGTHPVSSQGTTADAVVAALTPVGTWVWAKTLGGPGADNINAVATLGSSVYVTGTFVGTGTFGTVPLSAHGTTDVDAFVAKLTEAGPATDVTWAVAAGGNGQDLPATLAASSAGLYVGGSYSSYVFNFGATALPAVSANLGTGFVGKLTDTGTAATFGWVLPATGAGSTYVQGLAVAGTALYVVGDFNRSVSLGGVSATSTITRVGFALKLVDAGSSASGTWARSVPSDGSSTLMAVAAQGAQVWAVGSYQGNLTLDALTLSNVNSTACVLRLTDAGAAATYTAAFGPTVSNGFGQGTALALAGPLVYAGGYGQGTFTFGTLTATLTATGNVGFLGVLSPYALAATTPATILPGLHFDPNPAYNAVLLTGGTPHTPGQVLDALGRLVATFTTDATGTAQLAPTLAPGVYVVRVGQQAARLAVQ